MSRHGRSWWRSPLIILGWSLALGVGYVISLNNGGNFPTGLFLFLGVLAFNFAVNSITEKLDTIIWKLEDVERRLSGGFDEADYTENMAQPPPVSSSAPPPLPSSSPPSPSFVEAYQQQFRRPRADTSTIENYQKQFLKK